MARNQKIYTTEPPELKMLTLQSPGAGIGYQSRILPGKQGLPQKGAICKKSQSNKSLAFPENGKTYSVAVVYEQVSMRLERQPEARV